MRGGVKGLAGVEGEDVVGPSQLELPLHHEQGRAGVGAGEGPLLPVADHSVPCEHVRDALGEGAREQLHVQLAQGYGPVVVQSGRARYLWAEPDVRVPPVHRRRGAAEDGPVGVDQEPLDGCREGLDETGLHVVRPWGLAIGLVQGELQVLHGVLLDLGTGLLRDLGHVAAEDRLEAGEVHRAFVIQFPPEGANREHTVVGLCEERLGVGDPHVPEARPARGLYLFRARAAFHRWAMSLAWRRQNSLMARLRSAARSARKWRMSSSRAAACLSSSSCSLPCVTRRDPGDAPDWMPCCAASAWYTAGAHAARVS